MQLAVRSSAPAPARLSPSAALTTRLSCHYTTTLYRFTITLHEDVGNRPLYDTTMAVKIRWLNLAINVRFIYVPNCGG